LNSVPSVSIFNLEEKVDIRTTSSIVLDFSFSPAASQQIALKSTAQDHLHFISNRQIDSLSNEMISSNTLFTDPSYESEVDSLISILSKYNFSSICLIYDYQATSRSQARLFKAFKPATFKVSLEIIFDDDWKTNDDHIKSVMNQIVKNSDVKVFVVLTTNTLASIIIREADRNGIGGTGYAWILNANAVKNIEEICRLEASTMTIEDLSLIQTGIIGVIPEDQDINEADETSRLFSSLESTFHLISKTETTSGRDLVKMLKGQKNSAGLKNTEKFSFSGNILRNFLVINIANNFRVQVGKWEVNSSKLDLSKDIIWPGGQTTVPLTDVHLLKLAFLCPFKDTKESFYIEAALSMAVNEINKNNFLGKTYKISPIYQPAVEVDEEIIRSIIKKLEKERILGYVGPFDSESSKIYSKVLSNDEVLRPLVSYGATSSELSKTSDFKSFLRLVQQDDYQATAVSMIVSQNKVKEIGLIYSDDIIGQAMYSSFIENLKTLQISIKNQQSKRKITFKLKENGKLSSKTLQSIDKALSEIVRNQIKIIVFIGNNKLTPEIAKQAHKKELYGKDYAWFGSDWITSDVFQDIDENYKSSKSEIMKVLRNSLFLSQKSIIGDIGSIFSNNFFNKTGANFTFSAILAYDSVYLYANSLKSLIQDDQDYNDGQVLLNTLRRSIFYGASGKVMFRTDTNDRSPYGYLVKNLQGSEMVPVLEYDPQSTITLNNNSYKPIQFYGGGSECPDDSWPTAFDCPFAEHMSEVSVDGVAVVISVGVFLFVVTLGISYFSYRRWKQVKIVQITQPVVRSWKDNLVQAQILIEFFQFIAIAPELVSLKIVVEIISNIFMFDVLKVAGSDKQDYWYFLIFISGLCFFWFFVVMIITTDTERFLVKNSCTRRIVGIINSAYLPFIGNTMFLPFSSILFDAFVCDHQAQGKQYVWRDCYMTCWSSDHIPFLIVSGLALILFEPAAVFLRPLWQQAKPGLNIKIQPFFLLLKTCFQILLISVSKSLQGISPLANGIIFTCIISAFGIATYKIKPFNYSRFNLWEISSISAICYFSILSTISLQYDPKNLMWFVALILGWGVILIVTLIFQRKKMPNLMMSAINKRPRRSLKDIFSSHKVTSIADFEMGKSMNNSEFFKAKQELENNQVVSYNRINPKDLTEANRERLNCIHEIEDLKVEGIEIK
jgi:ABC-type branched-subunit amino acid transport system substrate-binding protein